MSVIAAFGWYDKVPAKRRACLQLNNIAAGCAGENLFQILPGTYRPSLSAGGSIFQ
jgi:hypothetical protein